MCGLKSAGDSLRNHLADCMRNIGYLSCLSDPDLWFKEETRPSDGAKYYTYFLLYIDDCLVILQASDTDLHELDHFFKINSGSIGDPNMYLGARLRKVVLENGVEAWATSASKYVQEDVSNSEAYLHEHFGSQKFAKKVNNPFESEYAPLMGSSDELGPILLNYYQTQIGELIWMVELGRIDIIADVYMLASKLALPWEGHLEAVFHIFGYLKGRHNAWMIFDPTYPTHDMSIFQEHDWCDFYGDMKEKIPTNAPEPRGEEVDLRIFVDSYHAGDKLTRRSRAGYIIFPNNAPIAWLSKKQATI